MASSRLKRRYILIKGSSKAIEKALIEYLGVLGWSKAAPVIQSESNYSIVAVNRDSVVHVRAACALSPDNLEVLRVSGTIKGLGRSNYHKA